jgi:DNA-binding NtrC family response regulator
LIDGVYIEMDSTRILAVDDEENFLALLRRTLEKEGYEVKTALSGEEAVRLLDEGPFDLALIDIRMARMNGLSLLEHIKRRNPDTKAIMITAYPSVQTRTLSLQKKASAFLAKPVGVDELKRTIRETLSK